MILTRFFLIFLFLLSSTANAGKNDLVINQQGDIFTDFTVEMYEDPSASLSFADIKSSNEFTHHSNRISTGYSSSVFWFRFTIVNKTNKSQIYFAEFTENFTHKVHGFIKSDSTNEVVKQKQGVAYLALENSDELLKPKFQINLASGESKTVYLNIFGLYANFTSFNIVDASTINEYELSHTSFYSIYFGAILALLIYNLAIYTFIRETTYLYYAVYVASFLIWQLGANGFYPFDRFSSSFNYYLNGLSIPIGLAFLMFFSRTVLDTKKLLPKFDKLIKYTAYIYLTLTISAVFYTHQSFIIISFVTTFSLPFLLFSAFKSYRLGNKTALILLIAQTAFLSMSTIFSLMTEGFLEYRVTTKHGLIAAFLVEIFIFSLAIAYRIRSLEQDKLKLIKQVNSGLDKKVKERTLELELSKKSLEISNKQLEKLANLDSLTGLYNRRFLYDLGTKLTLIAKREQGTLSVIMFDIDDFKSINDTFGHAAGDSVIIAFSKLLQHTRESDIAARVGGEEFILILPNTSEQDAYDIASHICQETEKLKIKTSDAAISFTISGGVSKVLVATDNGIELAIHKADHALYQAKNAGKNKITIFSSY